MAQNTKSRTITAAEVKSWFGNSSKWQLSDAQYHDLASYLTRWRWPCDPIDGSDRASSNEEIEQNVYWDFKPATDATKLLIESMPAMLRHWNDLQWAPETRGGYRAIVKLETALNAALPYIEWPFGRYEGRRTGRIRPRPWHLPAVLIAKALIKAVVEAGHDEPSFNRRSLAVRVVQKALIRIGYPGIQMVTSSAVAAYLTRWDKRYGLTLKRQRR